MSEQSSQAMPAGTTAITSVVVHQWQCDHFGHLNVRNYAAMFDDALFVFWAKNGFAHGGGVAPVTADLRISFRAEVLVGAVLSIRARVSRIGSKSATLTLDMLDEPTLELRATCEVVEVFFNTERRESCAIPELLKERLGSLQRAEELELRNQT
jgi:acyl-CoA thioester hydrolase